MSLFVVVVVVVYTYIMFIGPLTQNLYIIKDDIPSSFMQNLQSVISSFRAIPECVDKLTLKWIHEGPQMVSLLLLFVYIV